MIALRPLRSLFLFTVAAALAPGLAAQKTAQPSLQLSSDVLAVGKTVTVVYSNPDKAGETVVVEVDNGMREGTELRSIKLRLDANGVGRAVWDVPEWWGANFNAPGVAEVHAPILR